MDKETVVGAFIDKRLDTGAGKLTAFDLLSRLAHTK